MAIEGGKYWQTGPLGPGFLIFFQQKSVGDVVSRRGEVYQDDSRIYKDDEDMLLIIKLAVMNRLI